MRGKAVGVLVFAVLLASSSAQAYMSEHFESYANQAAYEAAWPAWGSAETPTTPHMALIQGFGHNSNQSTAGVAQANNKMWCYQNLDSFTGYTAANGMAWDFMLYDSDSTLPASPNPARNFIALRAYGTGNGQGEGLPATFQDLDPDGAGPLTAKGLQALVAMGLYESATTQFDGGAAGRGYYGFRLIYGGKNSWWATEKKRSVGWHHFRMVLTKTDARIYVDNMVTPDTVVPWTNPAAFYAFDGAIIGSGLTSASYDVAFDALNITPEPTALVLLGLGSVLLLRRR